MNIFKVHLAFIYNVKKNPFSFVLQIMQFHCYTLSEKVLFEIAASEHPSAFAGPVLGEYIYSRIIMRCAVLAN